MDKIDLLILGGIPDDNRVEVRRWTPNGVDLLFDGNVTVDALMSDPRLQLMQLVFGGSTPSREFNLPRRPDVAFNLVCSAEASSRALAMAQDVCRRLADDGIPILNPPDSIQQTTRAASTAYFTGLDRIVVPAVRRLASPDVRSIRHLLEAQEIRYPTIIRTTADHNGQNMIRLRGPADMDELERLPFDGRDYYAMPFIDYQNANGHYGKLRLVKVGGKILPRHMILGEDWKVHSGQRAEEINTSDAAIARERAYLENPEGFLGQRLYSQLGTALERTGLDYVGVDFGLLDDGRAVLFECNACTNAATRTRHARTTPARAAAVERIKAAFYDCVHGAAVACRTETEEQES